MSCNTKDVFLKILIMKNNILLYVAAASIFSFASTAQQRKSYLVDKTKKNIQKTYKKSQYLKTVKSYHVEENINMNFGGYTTSYDVSDASLISTTDLGPNNTRIITTIFVQIEQHKEPYKETITNSLQPSAKPSKLTQIDSLQKQVGYASVSMIETYERVAEKGYKSIDIFQKLGNAFYFNDELDKAARWYGELFAITSDLKQEYYYRYSASLKAIGENEKANEMLARFNQLSGNDKGQ
jgi:tetratricopeptide (TPR) repeat protein